jgi:hypothetical protein
MRLVRCDGMDGVVGDLDGAFINFVDDGRPMIMLVSMSETWRKCNVLPFGRLRPDSCNRAGS